MYNDGDILSIIEYNPSKSSIMYIDSRKAGNARSMTIGGKLLNVVTVFLLSHTLDILYVMIYPMRLI